MFQGENPTNHATVLSILKRKEGGHSQDFLEKLAHSFIQNIYDF